MVAQQGELIDTGFQKKVKAAIEAVRDLRPAFLAIANHWYKDNAQIFVYKNSTINYKPLSKKYIKQKVRKQIDMGLPHRPDGTPILRFTGTMLKSIINPKAEGAVYEITKTNLTLGTEIPYGIYHQSRASRGKMPYRPFIINKEAGNPVAHVFTTRTKVYTRLLETFVRRRVKQSQGG